MAYNEWMERAKELATTKDAKQIVRILENKYAEFAKLSKQAKFRDVYRWIESEKNKPANWIEVYKKKHKRLPPIPKFIGLMTDGYSPGARVSKIMKLTILSAQYWNHTLLPSQREQTLQLVDWLGLDRDDFEEEIKRRTPGSPSEICLNFKRKMA